MALGVREMKERIAIEVHVTVMRAFIQPVAGSVYGFRNARAARLGA